MPSFSPEWEQAYHMKRLQREQAKRAQASICASDQGDAGPVAETVPVPDKGPGACTELQELEAAPVLSAPGQPEMFKMWPQTDPPRFRDGQRLPKGNGRNYRKYRLAIYIYHSNHLHRDVNGGASTLLDCLRDARRRLLELYS